MERALRRATPSDLVSVADLLGTGFFALQGAATAALAGLDVFGVLVVAFVTALGGGIVRDVLLGDTPPAAFRSTAYLVAVLTGGGLTILLFSVVRALPAAVLIPIDAAALSLFAVVGGVKALDHRMSPVLAPLFGAMSGVGGGVMRDILLDQVPLVLRADVYAVAALAGAAGAVAGIRLGLPRWVAMAAGALLCLTLRLLAVTLGWNLPRIAG